MASVLWLSQKDVNAAGLEALECIDLVRKSTRWRALGLLEVPPKIAIHPPRGRHINAMPAFAGVIPAAGMKWIADFPQNRQLGIPTIQGIVVLSDPDTGTPLCVMDGASITAARTAAMTALSLQTCALPGVTTGAIVGTGTEARSHVLTLPRGLPTLKTLRIVGRTRDAADRFCEMLQPNSEVELSPGIDREAAVRQAGIVVTVTNATTTPLLEANWLSPGTTVVVLDNPGKETKILDCFDRVIVDDPHPFATDEVKRRFPMGVPVIDADLGEILTSRVRGRTNAEERILVMNLGSAACDVVVAQEIYARCKASGSGTVVEL